jgi:hypothetical protein
MKYVDGSSLYFALRSNPAKWQDPLGNSFWYGHSSSLLSAEYYKGIGGGFDITADSFTMDCPCNQIRKIDRFRIRGELGLGIGVKFSFLGAKIAVLLKVLTLKADFEYKCKGPCYPKSGVPPTPPCCQYCYDSGVIAGPRVTAAIFGGVTLTVAGTFSGRICHNGPSCPTPGLTTQLCGEYQSSVRGFIAGAFIQYTVKYSYACTAPLPLGL